MTETCSILGDSISTYFNCRSNPFPVFYTKELCQRMGIQSVNEIWWKIVIDDQNWQLCANSAFSGGRVSGAGFPAAYSRERIDALSTVENVPDKILLYIGFNDFANGVPLKRKSVFRRDLQTFEDAYREMLHCIHAHYPSATIACGTLMQTYIHGKNWEFPDSFGGISIDAYNNVIRRCAKKEKCKLADLEKTRIRYETLDGTHPTKLGHSELAAAWLSCL